MPIMQYMVEVIQNAPDLDRSVPALANCPETERWDRSSGPEGLGQWMVWEGGVLLSRMAVQLFMQTGCR